MQNNPILVVLPGDFNAKSSNWCKTDIITSEGKVIENIPSQFALHQVSNEPTHILESSSSCIDLIFSSQPNLITESGIHPSLHSNSHHQIIFAKFNLEFIFLSLYFRNTWHYQDANTDLVRRATDMIHWDRAFVNTNVNEKVFMLNRTIMNILSNFIPHKTVTVDDNDPSWFTKKKNLTQEKNNVYTSYRNSKNNNNIQYLRRLKLLQEDLRIEIEVLKSNYYSLITYKLTHIQKNSQVYWELLKRVLNNKKIPLIPPLFHGNEYVTDFKKKAELFNSFFATRCSLISNTSKLPLNLHFTTEKLLDTLNFFNK